MPQFPPRRTQPMRVDSYRRIARLLHATADKLDAYADMSEPRHQGAVTQMLRTLRHRARYWDERHRATVDGTLTMPPRALARPHGEE